MTERPARPWLNYLLGLLCIGAIVLAVLLVGPASGNTTAVTRTAKAAEGVVQSTVSGSGNLQPASQLNLGFRTGGTVTKIYVTQGEHVTEGKLIAELDPQSAEVTLEQAKAALLSARATLAKEEETEGEGSSAARSESTNLTSQGAGSKKSNATSPSQSSSSTSTVSAATREANLASARAEVRSDELTVQSDEEALGATKLYAPRNGTIVSLSGQVGEVLSATGTTNDSASGSSLSSSGSTSSATGSSATTGRSTGGASSSSSPTSSSSSGAASSGSPNSPFAVLSDLSSMRLVVALSQSEIGNVKVGQIATVTVEALESPTGTAPGAQASKLAAHVSEVATLSTTSSGVVSYDVTFQLDQMTAGLKPGMSATAEVVIKQAEGVNVPNSAITANSVTVVRGGKDVPQRIVSGLAGNASTIVLSGLKAGETVVLPPATSTSSSTNLTSRLSRLTGGGGGGLGGGGAPGGGSLPGGGAASFPGGG